VPEMYNLFVLVPASTLSINDAFMHHKPRTKREKVLKELLAEVIKTGVADFYRPKFDPSFDENGRLCYQAGLMPAVGKTYSWWEKEAKDFCPERNSRLGTKVEYVAFLGVLLKKLVAEGWKVAAAWNAVCNSSRKLGHYCTSKGARNKYEPTGSREVCGYFDLANAWKVVAEDKGFDGFWRCSGGYYHLGSSCPLADFWYLDKPDEILAYGVGWIVLEA